MKTSKDLTNGPIVKQVILFSLPILAGQLFQTLYNTVDALVVGREVGKIALAAVVSSNDISQLLIGFFTGLSNGAAVVFARYFGAKDYKKLKEAIHTTVLFGLILGVLMTYVGIYLSPTFLKIIDCPPDVFDEALSYLRIYLFGIQFTSIYNIAACTLRAVGDSKSPFNYLVISSLINIFLDILFVSVFKLGVNGVAYATVIAQFVSVYLAFRKMFITEDVYQLRLKDLKIDKKLLADVAILGLPSAIQACMITISNMFVQRWVNRFGSTIMAGYGAGKKTDKALSAIASSISYAAATYVAQNFGARKMDRVKKGIWACLFIAWIPTIVLGVLMVIYAPQLVGLFIDDYEAISVGVTMIRITVPLYLFQPSYHIMAYVIRGFGKSIVSMICTSMGLIVVRQIFLQTMMSLSEDIRFVFISFPIGWISTLLFTLIYYFTVIRKKYMREI